MHIHRPLFYFYFIQFESFWLASIHHTAKNTYLTLTLLPVAFYLPKSRVASSANLLPRCYYHVSKLIDCSLIFNPLIIFLLTYTATYPWVSMPPSAFQYTFPLIIQVHTVDWNLAHMFPSLREKDIQPLFLDTFPFQRTVWNILQASYSTVSKINIHPLSRMKAIFSSLKPQNHAQRP